jgi:hypothetical protein
MVRIIYGADAAPKDQNLLCTLEYDYADSFWGGSCSTVQIIVFGGCILGPVSTLDDSTRSSMIQEANLTGLIRYMLPWRKARSREHASWAWLVIERTINALQSGAPGALVF